MTRAPGSGISDREIGLMWTGLPGDPTLTLDLCRQGGRMKTRLDEHRTKSLKTRVEALVNEVLDDEDSFSILRDTCHISFETLGEDFVEVSFQTQFSESDKRRFGGKFLVSEEICSYGFVHSDVMKVDRLIRNAIVGHVKHLFQPVEI